MISDSSRNSRNWTFPYGILYSGEGREEKKGTAIRSIIPARDFLRISALNPVAEKKISLYGFSSFSGIHKR
jgi:hypothetical protein